MANVEARRIASLEAALKTVERPVFLGNMTRPKVIEFTAEDVLTIAKRYELFIVLGA